MDHLLFQGELPIVVVQEHEVSSFLMDHHEYRNTWTTPIARQVLQYLDGARQKCR